MLDEKNITYLNTFSAGPFSWKRTPRAKLRVVTTRVDKNLLANLELRDNMASI